MTTDPTSAAAAAMTAFSCPTILLRNGMQHPAIGFGTYKVGCVPASASSAAATTTTTTPDASPKRTAVECITDALECGYRFFECAEFYGNEASVGAALAQFQTGGTILPREELFLCSKVWTATIEQGPEAIRLQFDQTRKDLGTDYLDLYLVHWPVPGHHVQAYKTLVELKNEGKIRGVGVSNYAWEDFLELKNDCSIAEADLPCVNQIEINPFLYRSKTISKFEEAGVALQSYRSLRDGKAMSDPMLVSVAAQVQRTPAQVLGRWCVQHGFVYLPKSVQRTRMEENAAVLDFQLSSAQMTRLDQLTTLDNLDIFVALYRKCVNRDTSKDGTLTGVKMDITVD